MKVPIYMMSLYSKWQRLNVAESLEDFVVEFLEEPWSRGSALLALLLLYAFFLAGTVRILREQALKEDQ